MAAPYSIDLRNKVVEVYKEEQVSQIDLAKMVNGVQMGTYF